MRISALAAGCAAVALLFGCAPRDDAADAERTGAVATTHMATTASTATDEEKIANAMSSAPDSIARHARILDWPAAEGSEFRELRAGTNGWTCYPSAPAQPGAIGEDPMCLDRVFQQWLEAFIAGREPRTTSVGFAYMFAGDRGASASDPHASDPATTPDWVVSGPHVMMIAPRAQYAGLPTTPAPGPWVMWSGTPYAHVMMPVR
jgi:hypothetical protein